MAETAFAAEVDLQKLLADHPGLLPGDQIDPGLPRRWLLVSREVGIPDQEQGGARWAFGKAKRQGGTSLDSSPS